MDVPVVVPGLLPLLVGAVLWARWLYRSRSDVPQIVRHVPWAMVAVAIATLASASWGLRIAFQAAAGSDASTRASRTAEGISIAMNATGIGYCLVVFTLLLLLVATLRSKKHELQQE